MEAPGAAGQAPALRQGHGPSYSLDPPANRRSQINELTDGLRVSVVCAGWGPTSPLFTQMKTTPAPCGQGGLLPGRVLSVSDRLQGDQAAARAQPHTNSVKSSTEEMRRLRWPVS